MSNRFKGADPDHSISSCPESPVAAFRGYDGHTKRRFHGHCQEPPILTRESLKCTPNSSGLTTYPITEIDQLFDDGFALCNSDRRLNTPSKWNEVEDKLHELSVFTSRSHDVHQQGIQLHFSVPVVGHCLIREDRRQIMERSWLRWRGKYFDPNWLYTLHGSNLRRLCPRGADHGLRETIGDDRLLSKAEYRGNAHKTKGVRQWKGCGYLEMDLGSVCNIRLLVLLGGYPRTFRQFPSTDNCRTLEASDESYVAPGRHYHGKYVYTVDEAELAWITSFDLYFRDLVTSKWRLYKAGLDGNNDMVNEKIHHVDILARYLRILPKSCHHRNQFRCRVYGTSQFAGSKLIGRGDDAAVPAEETVRYTLHAPQTSMLRHDGIMGGSYWKRENFLKEKKYIRKTIANNLRQDQKVFYQHELYSDSDD